jgi:hypothetical protein
MNGLITSLGLMIWAYITMRALNQADESKTWYTFITAIAAFTSINYFCYDLILNAASLNDFKQVSREDTDFIGVLFLIGTVISFVIAAVRAIRRLGTKPVSGAATLTREEIQKQLDDHKRSLGITVPDRE